MPTTLRPDGRSRPPHLRSWRDGWRHLRFLLAFSPRWLFLYPAIALTTLGFIGFGVLAFGTVKVGAVSFDVQTMLAAGCALIVGLQLGALALVARAYSTQLGLLPSSPRLERALDRFTLEWGVIVGGVMSVGGVLLFILAVLRWRGTGFGRLGINDLRVPLAGMILVTVGVQVIASSFMLSLTRIGEGPRDVRG